MQSNRGLDDANEANCIPVRVSRLVKQTSASQLKGGKKKKGGTVEDIQAFQVSGLNAFSSALSSLLNAS